MLPTALTEEAVTNVICKMLGTSIIRSKFQSRQLKGGTVGDVRLVTGTAITASGESIPYKLVQKIQKNGNAGAIHIHGVGSTTFICHA